eukprot:7378056-Prymnesium_polylepis.3
MVALGVGPGGTALPTPAAAPGGAHAVAHGAAHGSAHESANGATDGAAHGLGVMAAGGRAADDPIVEMMMQIAELS